MERTPLLPLPEGMLIDQIQITENGLVIAIVATPPTSCCPLCSERSSSIHSHYRRSLRDVACGGRRVQLVLTVRKFYCRNPLCERKVFTERFPAFVEPWARMTIRHCEQITSIGLATCGKGGTRLAARLGIRTTRQTILRRIMALPDSPAESILFLGIDDFSFLRGFRFGTILVNLESHHVVDLLPDRVGEALEGLLAHHLARERRRQTDAVVDSQAPIGQSKRATRASPKLERLQQHRREERLARYEQVIALRKLGLSQAAIAKPGRNRGEHRAKLVGCWHISRAQTT